MTNVRICLSICCSFCSTDLAVLQWHLSCVFFLAWQQQQQTDNTVFIFTGNVPQTSSSAHQHLWEQMFFISWPLWSDGPLKKYQMWFLTLSCVPYTVPSVYRLNCCALYFFFTMTCISSCFSAEVCLCKSRTCFYCIASWSRSRL